MELVNFTPRRVKVTIITYTGEYGVDVVVAPAQQDQSVLPEPDGRRVYIVDSADRADGRDDVAVVGGGWTRLNDMMSVRAH